MKIAPNNWAEFQHYKDRSPPWIKLHKGLLNNPKWHRLQLASKALAPLLWLLASEEKDGVIDETAEDIAFRLRCTPEEAEIAINDLIQQGFFIKFESVASKAIAKRQQVAVPEERRGEVEGEAYKPETERETDCGEGKPPPNPLNLPTWKSYKQAYSQRYGVDPVQNSKSNSLIKRLVVLLGSEAPDVAAYYVRSSAATYVRDKHGLTLLVRDAEGMRTEWATGRSVTHTAALQADKTETRGNVFRELIEEAKNAAIT